MTPTKFIEQPVPIYAKNRLLGPRLLIIVDTGMNNTQITAGLVLSLGDSGIFLKQEYPLISTGKFPGHCTTNNTATNNGYRNFAGQVKPPLDRNDFWIESHLFEFLSYFFSIDRVHHSDEIRFIAL